MPTDCDDGLSVISDHTNLVVVTIGDEQITLTINTHTERIMGWDGNKGCGERVG